VSASHSYFAPAPRGFVGLLAAELRQLGVQDARERGAGVAFSGSLELGYRVCLWSRLTSRVLLEIAGGHADDPDTLYELTRRVDWRDHLRQDHTFAVHVSQAQSSINHTHFATLRVKDAVVDQWREAHGDRPSVDALHPGLRLHVHVLRREVTFYVDLAGESLHRRGYRGDGVAAPLKENVAAGILLRAGWPEIASQGGALVDPMCGSGTLLIEAAWMISDVAPGVLRTRCGAEGWVHHDAALWQKLRSEVEERRRSGALSATIVGGDIDTGAVRAASANLARAGLGDQVSAKQNDARAAHRLLPSTPLTGLVICNPPYGERLGEREQAESLYVDFGAALREQFGGWHAGVLTTDSDLAAHLGLRARRRLEINNGPLECQLLEFDLLDVAERRRRQAEAEARKSALRAQVADGAFANRLRKNMRKLTPWARREGISCFRLYDADIPEYSVAVDSYDGWLHVQEYQPAKTVDAKAARRRLEEINAALALVCELPGERIVLKPHARQRGARASKHHDRGEWLQVREGELCFAVNLFDYPDAGLHLDGRLLRQRLAERAAGKRVLNLFGHTGTATVAAIRGGARATTTVDDSQAYLDWAQRNLELNGVATGRHHRLERADCLQWLSSSRAEFDLIYLDAPAFSRSNKNRGPFEVQRDHLALIQQVMSRLADGGALIFVTSRRGFKLDRGACESFAVHEWTRHTTPRDFPRRTPHQSFMLTPAR